MSDLPFMPLWVSKYEAHTAHLTLCEDGAYLRLLRLCWRTPGGTIPADDAWVTRQMRVDAETFASTVKPILREFFTVRRGRYVNDALKRFFDEANEKNVRRKNAGRKGGEAKARKTKETGPSNATALVQHCSSKTETETETETHTELTDANASVSAPRAKRTRERPAVEPVFMADDWWPSEEDFAWATDPRNTKGIGLTREEVENETHQCKRWFLDKRDAGDRAGKRPGHTRSWQNWICRASPEIVRSRPRANGSAGSRPATQAKYAPNVSLFDALADAGIAASDPRANAGWRPDHGAGGRADERHPAIEVLDSLDSVGAGAGRSEDDYSGAGAVVLALPRAGSR